MSSDTSQWGYGRWGRFKWPENPPVWRVDGSAVENLVSETRTWQEMELSWVVPTHVKDDRLAYLRETAEKYDVVLQSGGSYSTLDRSEKGGVVTLDPPENRKPPRQRRDWVVKDYQQEQANQDEDSHRVTVTFVALSNREPDGTATDESRASDEFAFQFRSAKVATPRVTANIREGTDTSADVVDLELILTAEQTKVVEESLTRQAAITVREVPDGANRFDDDSPRDRNQVIVTTPDGEDPFPEGKYVGSDWQTEWINDRAYRVTVTLGPLDLGRTGWGWAQWGNFNYGQL